MKVTASCEACGASFGAPASLQGQVVKCPACGGNIEIPELGGQSPAQSAAARPTAGAGNHGSSMHGTGISGAPTSDGTAFGRSSSAAGRSGIRLKSHNAPSNAAGLPPGHDDESDLERVQKNRLFQAYAGIDERSQNRKFKFSLGLGIAALVLLVGLGTGIYLVINNTRTVPEVDRLVHRPAPPADPTPPAVTPAPAPDADAPAPTDAAQAPAPAPAVAEGPRPQAVSASARWAENSPLGRSATSAQVRVDARWEPATGRFVFDTRVTPDASGLNMASRVILYRATAAEGPFTQADATKPTTLDPSGSLIFSLFDAQAPELGTNRVYYRISGEDGSGRRLFDSAPAEFPVLPPMQAAGGRLTWTPASATEPMPGVRAVVTAAAPGWDGAVVAQVAPTGPLDMAIPGREAGLPVRVAVRTQFPTSLETSTKAMGEWQTGPQEHVLIEPQASATAPAGVLPVWSQDELAYRPIPDRGAFSALNESAGEAGATVVSFQAPGLTQPQAVTLPAVPAPRRVMVTPFEQSIRVSWDNRELVNGLDRFEGDVAVAVFRQEEGGPRQVVAMLPPDQASYTDTAVTPGVPVTYEVRLTSKQSAMAPAMVKAEAFLVGTGSVPVLVAADPGKLAAPVAAEPGLTQLHVAFSRSELCYPNTDRAAIAVRRAIHEALAREAGVSVVERDGLALAAERVQRLGLLQPVSAGGEGMIAPALHGAPAHMQLRLIDAMDRRGPRIELWCTDLLSGERWRLGEAAAGSVKDAASAAPLVEPLVELVRACVPEVSPAESTVAPTQIVMGAVLPIDEPLRYYAAEGLAGSLVAAAQKAGVSIQMASHVHAMGDDTPLAAPGVVVLSGRAWSNGGIRPGVSLTAMDGPTGRVIATFHEDEVRNETEKAFAAWCAGLKTPEPTPALLAMRPATSSLLQREAALPPLHPVFASAEAQALRPEGTPDLAAPVAPNLATFAFGLPLPERLAHPPGIARRPMSDPLSELRPYIVQPTPITFSAWSTAYAEYLIADYKAFQVGVEMVNATLRERGPVVPRFVVRGQSGMIGASALPARAINPPQPESLTLQGLFSLGTASDSMVQYRTDLEQQFQRRPYAAYHAWREAPPHLAEPFLKSLVLGVQNGQFGRLDFNQTTPPEFWQYLAARALEERSIPTVQNWRKRGMENALATFRQLMQAGGQSHGQQQQVANAILILLFEGEPTVTNAMRDPAVLTAFLKLDAEPAADALRLLVDRLGPGAWQWAQAQPSLAWEAFLWKDDAEMRLVTDALAMSLPQPLLQAVRTWLDAPALATPQTDPPVASPASAPRAAVNGG